MTYLIDFLVGCLVLAAGVCFWLLRREARRDFTGRIDDGDGDHDGGG